METPPVRTEVARARAWSVTERMGVLYLVRSGDWHANVRVSSRGGVDATPRAQQVCEVLNRLTG